MIFSIIVIVLFSANIYMDVLKLKSDTRTAKAYENLATETRLCKESLEANHRESMERSAKNLEQLKELRRRTSLSS